MTACPRPSPSRPPSAPAATWSGRRWPDDLGLPFFDRAIPATVATRLAVPLEEVAAQDEKPPSTWNRLGRAFANMAVPMVPQSPVSPGRRPGQVPPGDRAHPPSDRRHHRRGGARPRCDGGPGRAARRAVRSSGRRRRSPGGPGRRERGHRPRVRSGSAARHRQRAGRLHAVLLPGPPGRSEPLRPRDRHHRDPASDLHRAHRPGRRGQDVRREPGRPAQPARAGAAPRRCSCRRSWPPARGCPRRRSGRPGLHPRARGR